MVLALLRQFEADRTAGLSLAHRRAGERVAVRRNVFDPQGDNIAASQLLSMARLNIAKSRVRLSICSLVRIDQTCLAKSGGFAPISFPLFQGMRFGGGRIEL
jgi:hypothetical protein